MHQLKLGFFGSIICVLLNISILNTYADTKPDFKKYAAGPERKKVFILSNYCHVLPSRLIGLLLHCNDYQSVL